MARKRAAPSQSTPETPGAYYLRTVRERDDAAARERLERWHRRVIRDWERWKKANEST